MATLQYKSSLSRYRRYLQTMQNQPLLRASLYLILSLVLMIILIAAALKPTLVTIAGLIGQIKEKQALEQKLDAKINTLKEAQQQLALASSRLIYLDEAIPQSAAISTWSDSMQRMASESGVAITNITLVNIPVAHVAQATPLGFQLTATGGYDQLYHLMQSLQNLRRLIKITKLNLANSTTEGLLLNVTGELTASP